MLARHSSSLAVLILVLFAGFLLLSGCGGDDSGPQTKEGFILDADGVCERFLTEFEDAGSRNPGTAQEVAEANKVLADVYGRFSDVMRQVRLPDGAGRTQAQAYVGSVRASEPLLERLRSTADAFLEAARGTDRQALAVAGNDLRAALDGFRATRARSDTLAVDYGLNLCGNLD